MSKRKRFNVGDIVDWRGAECVVTSVDPLRVHHTCPGLNRDHEVRTVRPLDDWRARLQPNDNVKYYFEGFWIHCHVHHVNPLILQPTFTRVLVDALPHEIRRTSVEIGHRFKLNDGPYGRLDQVLYKGEWYVVDKCTSLYVLSIDGHYLPLGEIAGSIPIVYPKIKIGSIECVHGTEFRDSVSILESIVSPLRNCWRHARQFLWRRYVPDLDDMVSSAIDHFDDDRVNSLTFVSAYMDVYEMSKWFEWRYCSLPYLKFDFNHSTVDIFWSGCCPISPYLMREFVKPVLEPLFVSKVSYIPVESTSQCLLDWQVPCVDKMCFFETVNVSNAFCDDVGLDEIVFSHYIGFLMNKLPEVYGGVLCADGGLGKTWMMLELFRRNPMRTLCVVPLCLIDHWSSICDQMGIGVSVWHGDRKECSESFVITTCRTLLRGALSDEKFDRLILDEAHLVKVSSASMKHLCSMSVQTRWYVSATPDFKGSCTFLHVFPFCADYEYDVGEIPHAVSLTRDVMPLLEFSEVNVETPQCWSEVKLTPSDMNILRYDSGMLPPEKLYDEILFGQDTLSNIEGRVERSIDISVNCPICLEVVQTPTITQCGHVFCKDCSLKMLDLGSNCAMCRGNLSPLLEVSDKPSQMLIINGKMYGGRDLSPGNMKLKLLALNSDRTIFITRSAKIYNDMQKYVQSVMLLRDCIGIHLDCDVLVFVDMAIPLPQYKRVLNRLINPLKTHKVDIVKFTT